MKSYMIPFDDKYIVYRPLLKLAFIANAAMVNLIAAIEKGPVERQKSNDPEAIGFLEQIGYLNDDPPIADQTHDDGAYNPTAAVLFLTNHCNLECVYCYAFGHAARGSTLPEELGCQAISMVCHPAMVYGKGTEGRNR